MLLLGIIWHELQALQQKVKVFMVIYQQGSYHRAFLDNNHLVMTDKTTEEMNQVESEN